MAPHLAIKVKKQRGTHVVAKHKFMGILYPKSIKFNETATLKQSNDLFLANVENQNFGLKNISSFRILLTQQLT